MQDPRIDESSGLAASRRYPGYLWTHNDSGDSARLFLISLAGRTAMIVNLKGATAIDCEDMAVAGAGPNAAVYLGDIGDNARRRHFITVYRFRESGLPSSSLDKASGAGNKSAPPVCDITAERADFVYPDGPHDAETLIANSGGDLLIVTKDRLGSLLFEAHFPSPGQALPASIRLRRLGTFTPGGVSWFSRLVTGGDLRPDGREVVLRTYTDAYRWTLEKPDALDDGWWNMTPLVSALPPMRQGESICYSTDGKRMYATSEQLPTPLVELAPLPPK